MDGEAKAYNELDCPAHTKRSAVCQEQNSEELNHQGGEHQGKSRRFKRGHGTAAARGERKMRRVLLQGGADISRAHLRGRGFCSFIGEQHLTEPCEASPASAAL
ncbi:hypothetical protein N7G274_010300 [Stereocaulon virgatum]|uniref:Uncharacterized protein n=1 Tax=Stereocaulon virgatum TaxID=373712 RepID=A0ABR3ZV48_9LECA